MHSLGLLVAPATSQTGLIEPPAPVAFNCRAQDGCVLRYRPPLRLVTTEPYLVSPTAPGPPSVLLTISRFLASLPKDPQHGS